MIYPILMADVIKSGRKDSILMMAQFKQLVAAINLDVKKNIVSPLTITLGDEFQGIFKNIESAIMAIFALEEYIIKNELEFKLKYVLNFGIIETIINKKMAYEMLGPGLTEARKNLSKLKKEDARFLIKINKDEIVNSLVNKAFFIYQSFIDAWKQKDFKTVSSFWENGDYKIVASKINTDISSAWRRKKSLHIIEYQAIKDLILSFNPKQKLNAH